MNDERPSPRAGTAAPSDPAGSRSGSPATRPTRRRSTSSSSTCAASLGYTDYFVICSGNTDRQAKAIHDGIHEGLKKRARAAAAPRRGLAEARWILMDYLDVVVHVFTPETRDYYRLEQLWGEAPRRAVGE